MKYIYITIVMLVILATGILIAKSYYDVSASYNFREFGQYEPEMILLDDEQMLYKCEEYNLTYDYEEGICK